MDGPSTSTVETMADPDRPISVRLSSGKRSVPVQPETEDATVECIEATVTDACSAPCGHCFARSVTDAQHADAAAHCPVCGKLFLLDEIMTTTLEPVACFSRHSPPLQLMSSPVGSVFCDADSAADSFRAHGVHITASAVAPDVALACRVDVLDALDRALLDLDTCAEVLTDDTTLSRYEIRLDLTRPVFALLQALLSEGSSAMGPLVRSLLGDDAYLCGLSCVVTDPGAPSQDAHSDAAAESEATEDGPTLVSAYVALGDVDEAAGFPVCYPRTHSSAFAGTLRRCGRLRALHPRTGLALDMRAGDAALVDGRLWRRGGANASGARLCLLRASFVASARSPPWHSAALSHLLRHLERARHSVAALGASEWCADWTAMPPASDVHPFFRIPTDHPESDEAEDEDEEGEEAADEEASHAVVLPRLLGRQLLELALCHVSSPAALCHVSAPAALCHGPPASEPRMHSSPHAVEPRMALCLAALHESLATGLDAVDTVASRAVAFRQVTAQAAGTGVAAAADAAVDDPETPASSGAAASGSSRQSSRRSSSRRGSSLLSRRSSRASAEVMTRVITSEAPWASDTARADESRCHAVPAAVPLSVIRALTSLRVLGPHRANDSRWGALQRCVDSQMAISARAAEEQLARRMARQAAAAAEAEEAAARRLSRRKSSIRGSSRALIELQVGDAKAVSSLASPLPSAHELTPRIRQSRAAGWRADEAGDSTQPERRRPLGLRAERHHRALRARRRRPRGLYRERLHCSEVERGPF